MNATAIHLVMHPALRADPPKGLVRNLKAIRVDPGLRMVGGFLVSGRKASPDSEYELIQAYPEAVLKVIVE